MKNFKPSAALAAAAHPDDIEFLMAGTLLKLKDAGLEIHMWNLANGSCGSDSLDGEEISKIRFKEAQASAIAAGAELHPPLVNDIEIFYEKELLSKAAAVIRKIKPDIILLPSPNDYMEDHQNTSRIIVTAAFVRGMRNFPTEPPVESWNGITALYHAMPHGLKDNLLRPVRPELFVDTGSVLDRKRDMLSRHKSQKEWLDHSQGIGTYISLMETMSKEIGKMSGKFELAEGWRRHSHWGFGPPDYNPLWEILTPDCFSDPDFES